MRGAVLRGHVAVRGLDQHLAIGADQDGPERMIAVRRRAARDIEGAAEKMLVAPGRTGRRDIDHQCPAMWRPISVRSASLARAS